MSFPWISVTDGSWQRCSVRNTETLIVLWTGVNWVNPGLVAHPGFVASILFNTSIVSLNQGTFRRLKDCHSDGDTNHYQPKKYLKSIPLTILSIFWKHIYKHINMTSPLKAKLDVFCCMTCSQGVDYFFLHPEDLPWVAGFNSLTFDGQVSISNSTSHHFGRIIHRYFPVQSPFLCSLW